MNRDQTTTAPPSRQSDQQFGEKQVVCRFWHLQSSVLDVVDLEVRHCFGITVVNAEYRHVGDRCVANKSKKSIFGC